MSCSHKSLQDFCSTCSVFELSKVCRLFNGYGSGTCLLDSNSFIFSSLWSKSDSQLSKYCVLCEISWCRCQQLTSLSISTALVTKLLVIEQLLHPAPKFAVSTPWHNFQLCPSSQQMRSMPLGYGTDKSSTRHTAVAKGLPVKLLSSLHSRQTICGLS